MPDRLVPDWVLWAVLWISVATSLIVILIEWQNIRSMRDRVELHQVQDQIMSSLRRLEARK